MSARGGSLVVIGSRTEPTLSGLGSTALKVVRKPACPVLIVRVAEDKPYDTILSAVDLREGSVRAASLAVDLFPVAQHHLLFALDSATGAADVPARAILLAAANLSANCIVVGHYGQGVATDSSLGSMAQHVIYAALGDVLVVP